MGPSLISSDRRAADHDCQVCLSDIPLYSLLRFVLCSVISPFVLTRELLPALKKAASQPDSDVRVVTVCASPQHCPVDLQLR